MSTNSADTQSKTLSDVEREIDEKFNEEYDSSIFSSSPIEWFVYIISTIFFVYHMWFAYTFSIPRSQHAIVHLAMILSLWGITRMLKMDQTTIRGKLLSGAYLAYSVVSVIPMYVFMRDYDAIVRTAGVYDNLHIYLGALVILLVLIALVHISRLITSIAIFGLIYSYYGPLMPGPLSHRGLSVERIITMNTIEMEGLFGSLLEISATWVVIFLLLAGIMEKYGGMAAFIKAMTRVAARQQYIQIGQVAVAASMFMGSINGSTAANTATTGSFTIPLMKENGYRGKVAGAIESVASCGGQVLPPIMGAGAFLMAELIEPNYSEIIIGAVVPALLFFAAVSVSISLNSSEKSNIVVNRPAPAATEYLRRLASFYEYVGMFAVLLYYLVIIRSDPMRAGFFAILALLGLRLVKVLAEASRTDEKATQDEMRLYIRQSIEGFRRGAEATLNITILLASLGIVIRALIVTGFAQQLSSQLVGLAGGSIIVMLLLAMIASILFGMGMSTTAAYMIVAILVAPSLVQIGVEEFSAHMFVFYFAIVSNITPPIALSVIIAQGISGSNFWETAVESLKIGYPMFLLPFAFIANDPLLYPSVATLFVSVVVLSGFISVSIGLNSRKEGLTYLHRLIYFVIGLGVVFAPSMLTQTALFMLAVLAIMYYFDWDLQRTLNITRS
ncbi:TRAP transporter fused permease subunit [Salinarchaeum sp. IM2453]|uniref:TRAP transporter permease n=1 Tax=Salinarchaeum sp. IM2453 TaxID=2862870 RepID=UPI001C839E2F|nr:TRAP transporter fused permease subunit [Salinarchaeum sp. IM2453]QZA88552.1 TRAP transporter fused permease subunit [Salinarchaeum sp. IM2453]